MSLVMSGVTHAYGGDKPVLEDVDLNVAEGEAVALVGPSGSGKTTLLSIAGLLTEPSSGTVAIGGVVANHRRRASLLAETAWVFQTPSLLGRRSVADNVALGALTKGLLRRDVGASVEAEVAAVGLSDLLHTPVFRLSGGEAQRTMIARALLSRPSLLLADEPTGQLDGSTSERIVSLLLRPKGARPTTVVATHDPAVAAACDRTVEIVNGATRAG